MRNLHRAKPAGFAGLVVLSIIMLASCAFAQDATLPPGDSPPPDAFSRIREAGTAADYEDAGVVVVLEKTVNHMKPSGVTYVDGYTLYKILTREGARDLSVLRWNYDPQSSHVEIREVSVIRDGKRLPVDVGAVHDLPAPQSMIYWNDRIKTLQLPRLKPGDGVEVKTFRKGFTYALLAAEEPDDSQYVPPMPGEYFDIVYFSADRPMVEKRYVLELPSGKMLHSQVYNGPLYSRTTYGPEGSVFEWWSLDVPAAVHEHGQPDRSDIVPKVVMATAESWEAKSRWFFDVNRDQFEVTPEISSKVEEILDEAGASRASEERKAEVLLHWVAQNIRYSGQTMGEGEGFTLHPGEMIFRQRSGVCKDIAGMLITMMRAAGMDSYAAMTMAGSRIEDVPADQFNHCVCALRKDDGSFEMYDPTWVPYNNDIWSLLEAEQHYLIGTPEGETLRRIAYSPPEGSPLTVEHDASLADDGSLSGRLLLKGSGAMDGRLRGIITRSSRNGIRETFAGLLAPVSPAVEVTAFDYRDADDFSGDMWMKIEYRIPGFAMKGDGWFEMESPMMQVVLGSGRLFRAAGYDDEEERKTDLFLYYTQAIDGRESIRLPKGFSLESEAACEEVDEVYGYFKGSARMKGRDLLITQRTEVRRRQIPPEGYPGLRKAIEEARSWGGRKLRIVKGGK